MPYKIEIRKWGWRTYKSAGPERFTSRQDADARARALYADFTIHYVRILECTQEKQA